MNQDEDSDDTLEFDAESTARVLRHHDEDRTTLAAAMRALEGRDPPPPAWLADEAREAIDHLELAADLMRIALERIDRDEALSKAAA
jgi:hypothetical protein